MKHPTKLTPEMVARIKANKDEALRRRAAVVAAAEAGASVDFQQHQQQLPVEFQQHQQQPPALLNQPTSSTVRTVPAYIVVLKNRSTSIPFFTQPPCRLCKAREIDDVVYWYLIQ